MLIQHSIPFRFIIKEIKTPLIIVTVIAVITDSLPIFLSEYLPDIPTATTLGTAISILLSFKISQS